MKTYIGISRDHSASMRSITDAAARDYNECISSIKDAALRENQVAMASVVECGAGSSNKVRLVEWNRPVFDLKPIPEKQYIANGIGTPLFDSVGELIERFELLEWDDVEATFLIMVITDGQENASVKWKGQKLAAKIRELQGSDHWTFTFRVPKGYKRELIKFGIPEGNILEWEQTVAGMETSTIATRDAVTRYFSGVKTGVTSTKSFYMNLAGVRPVDVQAALVDISSKVISLNVPQFNVLIIKDFFKCYGIKYEAGIAYYQLTKSEKVQQTKNIIVYDKNNGKYYTGVSARSLLGLPYAYSGTVHVLPDKKNNKFDIFVQSTSYNRKLVPGTRVLVYKG